MSSAQVKTAKETLDQAITGYKYNKAIVSKLIQSNEVPNERTFRNKLKAFDDALTALNSAHTSWVSKAGFTDDDLSQEHYSLSWLENEWSEAADLEEQVESKLSTLTAPTQSNKDKLLICNNQMESLRLNIERKVDNLHESTNSSAQINSTDGFSELLTDIGSCLNDFTVLADKIHSLDINNIETNSQRFEIFRQTQQKKIADIELRLAAERSTIP